VLLTRSPLEYPRKGLSARLACVKHAASVRPEPGSNSPKRTQTQQPNKQHSIAEKHKRHWHNKHPVEFSKNKPRTGATAPVYTFGDACQIFDSKTLIIAIAQTITSTIVEEKGSGGSGRPAGLRRARPAPAGWTTLPGKFRSCKPAFTVLPRTAREARLARYSEVSPCLSGPLRHGESYKHTGPNVKSAAQRILNPGKTAAGPRRIGRKTAPDGPALSRTRTACS
jgi:hypothetical protein